MSRVVVTVHVAAPPARVWQALCAPEEVREWDGAVPVSVPADYPRPGQVARWRSSLGGWPVTLHDHVVSVEPGHRLAARLAWSFVTVDEEYRLTADVAGTVLVCDNRVGSRLPGLDGLATGLVRRATRASMTRLVGHCS